MKSWTIKLTNWIILVYLFSFTSYLYYGGQEEKLLRFGLLFFILYFSVLLTSIPSRDKLTFSYNRTYAITVITIILIMIATPMNYWVISLAIPPLAFYYFRVRNETRDVCLSDFRDLKKIALRIESSETYFYIMDRIIILMGSYLVSKFPFIDEKVAREYVPMIIPILIHDIVMIILYFQMEYIPPTEDGPAEETHSE